MSADAVNVKKKIVLIGDAAVGKTSLMKKFVTDEFPDEYIVTLGVKVMINSVRFLLSLVLLNRLPMTGISFNTGMPPLEVVMSSRIKPPSTMVWPL